MKTVYWIAVAGLVCVCLAALSNPFTITTSNGLTFKINRITGATWVWHPEKSVFLPVASK